MLTPSCPVSLVQYQCFLLALITIRVTGDVRLGHHISSIQCQNARRSSTIRR
ncbi:unnamed protein product [Staurois parvus]|uniref:Uncharacterized protein n=1 Tax=Staurois parvus TaxID=386267 RepID=A0ABN9EWH9_9NEOB|nr:unnamed protein product [Staurois parvus]